MNEKDATIEHKTSCVDHWNNGGNNMTREERNDFYNDTSNWDVLPGNINSSEGAMMDEYIQETGETTQLVVVKNNKKI